MKNRKQKILLLLSVVLSLGLAFTATFFTASAADTESNNLVIVDTSTEWYFLDNGNDAAYQGLASDATGVDLTRWTTKAYTPDTAYGWKTGSGAFGAKSGKLSTINSGKTEQMTPTKLVNQYYEGTSTNIETIFFRTTVNIENLDEYETVYINMVGDDGFCLYINGHSVVEHRKYKAGTAEQGNMYYDTASGGRIAQSTIEIDKSYLVEGKNVICGETHNENATSSDICFAVYEISLTPKAPPVVVVPDAVELPVLSVGADTSERRLAWFSPSADAGEVRLAKASEVVNGVFPTEYTTFSVTSKVAVNVSDRYAKAATITGLEADTKYAYTIVTDGEADEIHYFTTVADGAYEFVYVGDPQISKAEHGEAWKDTLEKIQTNFGVDLLISGGDQVGTANDETLYSYVVQDELLNFTFAPTVGPGHDSTSATFSDHYNLPNLSTQYGVGKTSSNYWYVYNNTLFMNINMEDNDALFNGEHEAFISEVLAENPNVKWKILIAHRAPFSTGLHGDPTYKNYESEVARIRPALSALATKMDIDIVLSAHDHVYVRTYMMINDQVSADTVAGGKVINPEGVLYITASSSTGSKFYDQKVKNAYFVAKENYEKRKSALHFEVTDTSIKFTTYFLDDMSVMDTFTIEKKEVEYTPSEDERLNTPYGLIDAEYADVNAYPVAVFDRGGTFLGAYEDMSGAFNAFFNQKKDVIVYLRADAKFGYRYHNIGVGGGIKIIDLNGKVLTTDASYLLYAQSKSGGFHQFTVKNGTIDTNGKYTWTLGANSNAKQQRLDCTFENVTFTNISQSIVTDGALSSVLEVTSTVIFNDCTFVNPTVPLFNIGNAALATQNVIVNGCTVKMNGTTLPSIVTMGNYSDNASLTFSGGSDGKCMKIITPKNDSSDVVVTHKANVFFAKSASASTSEESVYVLSEKTPYGYIDEEHLDASRYPMVLYLGDTVLYPDTFGEESGNTVVKQYFMDNPKKTAVLYVRTDCTFAGKNYWTGNIQGSFTIDLGGNTVTAGCILYMQSRSSETATILVKNGTLHSTGTLVSVGTNNRNNKHSEITFENVVINNVKKSLTSIGHNSKNEAYLSYVMSANIYFNNCTFNVLSSMETSVFAYDQTDMRCTVGIYVNNCTFNVENGQYSIFSTGEGTPRSIYFDENTKLTIANTADLSGVTELTKDGVLLGLRKTGGDETNATYRFSPFDITSAYLNLTNDLNLVYRVFLPAGYENPTAIFTVDTHTIEVSSYTIDENGLYCFMLSEIGPHRMGDTVTATVTATYNGATETLTDSTLSVKSYIDTVRAENADNESLIALLDALLVYGASAQVYMGHNTDNLVGEIGELSEIPEQAEITLSGEKSEIAAIEAVGLRLGGAFDLRLGIRATDISGLSIVVTKGGESTTLSLSEDAKNDGYYVVYYNGLVASELDEQITVTVMKDGEAIGQTLTLSANAYLAYQQTSGNEALANLVKALYAYGIAANAFAE